MNCLFKFSRRNDTRFRFDWSPHTLFDVASLLSQVLFSFQSEFGHSPRAAARQEDLARWS